MPHNTDTVVQVHLAIKSPAGEELYNTRHCGIPFSFTIGRDEVSNEIETTALQLKIPGDVQAVQSTVSKIAPFLSAQPSQPVTAEIELVAFGQPPSLFREDETDSAKKKLQKCRDWKEDGNFMVKDSQYPAAKSLYSRAIKQLLKLRKTTRSSADSEEISQLLLACRLNLSLCYLKLGRPAKCIRHCTHVLRLHPDNSKALYRKGLALLESQEYETARAQFSLCLELQPDNAEAKQQLSRTDKLQRAYHEKQRQMFGGLFGS
eukprot:TRINITY_DN81487_c0_g1_i1.p1 TRINITY_DN81487_c0_g1~~TRINITY_DN81487_c0_g1_i1.p1  ORF type:complete len:262 (-),score=50.27 TRINITY_DN81487_c0_g1_i1:7-792(-)